MDLEGVGIADVDLGTCSVLMAEKFEAACWYSKSAGKAESGQFLSGVEGETLLVADRRSQAERKPTAASLGCTSARPI